MTTTPESLSAAMVSALRGRLIVSCQAYPGEPMRTPDTMTRMAQAVVLGGAAAVRAQGLDDIRGIRSAVDVPIIGLVKEGADGVVITPTLELALAVAEAGAHVVAIDGTARPRPDGHSLAHVVAAIHDRTDALVMADISTLAEAVAAAAAGADLVGTTLAGYTAYTTKTDGPDLTLLREVVAAVDVPVIAEGRIHTPAQAAEALARGAHSVVVGTAITHPTTITRWFVSALSLSRSMSNMGFGAESAGDDAGQRKDAGMTHSYLPHRITGSVRGRRLGTAACAAVLATAGMALPAQAAPMDPPGSFTEQNLAPTLISPFGAYRIPALSYLGSNVVVAAWDGRPGGASDSPNPNSIVMRRSTDGGATWSTQTTVRAGNQDLANGGAAKDGYSDPSFVYDAVANKLFLFSVYSKDQGFAGSIFGNDDANRQVISAQVSESDDGGLSWGAPRLITRVVKPGTSATSPQTGDVRSMFASSGEGIQLKYGTHAGRLIQQYAGDVRQSNGSNKIQAYSVYSDDHGTTWSMGTPVGDRMDENKTVELSDGTVMLNSRDNANLGYRKVALSTDGGQTYGTVSQDTELPDPANNGSITRLFPDAASGTADAKKLLFTNANSQTARQNLSARVSCDDGASWSSVRTIRSGFSAYSTATRLGNGKIGVLYETSYSTGISMAQFDDAWLNNPCVP